MEDNPSHGIGMKHHCRVLEIFL